MRNLAILLAVLPMSSTLLAAAKMIPGRYPEKAAVWQRFSIRDIQLGAEIDKLPGFICDSGVGEFRHTCVQFIDERCKGRKGYVRSINQSSDIPPGQSCFYDRSNSGTYLDGQYQRTPLSTLVVVGTDTYVPRAYEIRFTFAKDALTEDSNLGRALLAKYGKPENAMAPYRMRWEAAGMYDLYLFAECGNNESPSGTFCYIEAHDGGLLIAERSVKASFDSEQQKRTAPPAPRF